MFFGRAVPQRMQGRSGLVGAYRGRKLYPRRLSLRGQLRGDQMQLCELDYSLCRRFVICLLRKGNRTDELFLKAYLPG